MKKFSINNLKLILAGTAMLGGQPCDDWPFNLIPDNQAFATAARIESTVLGVCWICSERFYLSSSERVSICAANALRYERRRYVQRSVVLRDNPCRFLQPQIANNNGQWISTEWSSCKHRLGKSDGAVASGVLTQEIADNYKGSRCFSCREQLPTANCWSTSQDLYSRSVSSWTHTEVLSTMTYPKVPIVRWSKRNCGWG
jgi:hypothetical protein